MADKTDNGLWIDATGTPIPAKYIDPVEKKRDIMVEKTFRSAIAMQRRLRKFKEQVQADVRTYLDWLARENGEDALSPGGNYKLRNFSGNRRVQVKIAKVIDFDERLQLAKQKIDSCLERWSDGADDKLKLVVFDAFNVDRKGNVDTKRVIGLRKLSIKDTEWNEAMDLITEAITVTGTRQYILFETRTAIDAPWETLRLDLAGV